MSTAACTTSANAPRRPTKTSGEGPALPQRRRSARDHFRARHHRGHQPGGQHLRAERTFRRATRSSSPPWSTTRTSSPGRCCARRKAPCCAWRPSTTRASCCGRSSRSCSARARDWWPSSHVSNVLGTINPVRQMIEMAHRWNVPVLLDGAQAAPHLKVDVRALDCDFYAFSGHKLFGPTGIGVLYGKAALLAAMPPYQGGGDMISSVTFAKTLYNVIPYKFEAGTPNIAGDAGLGAAIDYLNRARVRRPGRPRAGVARLRHRGARADPRPAAHRHGKREGGGALASCSTACTRTTWARFWTRKASRSAPATTALSR